MAIRSLLLSLALTGFLGYSLTVGITDPESFLKKIPEWLGIPLALAGAPLYLLATWWAIKGFSDHKLTALLSLVCCVFGLGLYALGFVMTIGAGKASPGQFDYDVTTLDPAEKAVVTQLAQDAGAGLTDAVFTEYWNLIKATEPESSRIVSTKSFRICVQRGHVIGLNLDNHPVRQLALFSRLSHLTYLSLKNSGLSDLSGLTSATIDRLDVSDNQLTDLKTLRGCPNIQWLFARNNQLTATDTLALSQFRQLVSTDFTGNPRH